MIKLRFSYCSAAFESRTHQLKVLYLWSCPPGAHHGYQAGLAAAALHSGIPDTLRWRLWWICLLLALWPPSDPSYWETSVSDWPTPNMLPHTHTHCLKHTLPVAFTACHTININWPFFMGTNTFHMLLASYEIILNFRGHNKSTQLLVLGSEKTTGCSARDIC